MAGENQKADTETVVEALIDLADVCFDFAQVERTSRFPDGTRRESDTDHTVMLGLAACALANWCAPDLDVGLVAQFALVHDLPEVYAGDICTLRPLSDDDRAAKTKREHAATQLLGKMFGPRLPWITGQLERYEKQEEPEARFVRGVDKILPELTHLLNRFATPRSKGVTPNELTDILAKLAASMGTYVGEFHGLMRLHDVLINRVLTQYRSLTTDDPAGGETASASS